MKLLGKIFKCKIKIMGDFFRAVFKNLYFKTKHSNETFHLGFYSLSNVFSYRKHISSKSNISVLTISGKSRNIKIIAPSPHFISNPLILWYSLNFSWGSFITTPPPPPPIYIFPEHPPPPPLQLSTKEYLNWMIFDIFMLADLFPSGLAAKT